MNIRLVEACIDEMINTSYLKYNLGYLFSESYEKIYKGVIKDVIKDYFWIGHFIDNCCEEIFPGKLIYDITSKDDALKVLYYAKKTLPLLIFK